MKTKNKIFTSIAILGSSIFAMVLATGSGIFEALGLFSSKATTDGSYNIILNENNAYSDENSKIISTSFGKNPIIFDYSSGCSAASNTHVYLAENATLGNYYKANNSDSDINWNNKLSSIESIKPIFSAESGASLQFRASYDGKTSGGTWGGFAPLTNNVAFTLTSKPYYIELKAVGGSVSLTSCEICYACLENTEAHGTPSYETKATVNGGNKKTYSVDDSFDSLIGGSAKSRSVTISDSFEVVETLSNGSTKTLSKNEFTYKVNNPSGTQIDTSKSFGATGTYTAYIKAGSLPEVIYEFDVAERLVESISIPSTKSMNTGVPGSISVSSILPSNAHNKVVAWSSSDTSVATINSSTGEINPIKAGTTIITASATDGSDVVSNQCTLIVSDIAVTSITLDEDSLTLYTDDDDVTLHATVLPDNATVKTVTWSSSDEGVATVTNGVVHPIAVGTAEIYATAGNKTATCYVEIKDSSEKPVILPATFAGVSNFAACTVNDKDGIKIGTSSKSGEFSITVPSGASKLSIYISAWNGENNTQLQIEPSSKVSVSTLDLLPNSGISGSSTSFTLSEGSNEEDYLFEISLIGITQETTLTFSSTKRVVAWNASYLISGGGTTDVKVRNISISPSSSTLTVGDTCSLTATVTPDDATNKEVNWSTSNSDVATVTSSGLITAIGKGNCVITATSTDGSEVSGTASITVNAASAVLSSISVSNQKTTYNVGDTFVEPLVTAHYSDGSTDNVTNEATFSGYNMSVAGTYTVSVSYGGQTATYNITVSSGETPSGDQNQITFDTVSEDASTPLDATGIRNFITEGSDYIESIDDYNKIFEGTEGLKIGASKSNGYLEFTTSSDISENETLAVVLSVSQYSTDTGMLEIIINDNVSFSCDPADNVITHTFESPLSITSFYIRTSAKRAYLSGITFITAPAIPVDPEGIELNSSSLNIGVNEESTLSYSFLPVGVNRNKGVAWSSSDSTVATVTNGVVKGLKAGNATITVKSTYDNSIKDTCNVTVTTIAVSSITLSPSSKEISVNGSVTLSATVLPSNASNKGLTWSTSNSAVASVDQNGQVTGVSAGTATITATAKDGSGKKGTTAITVSAVKRDAWTLLIYMCGADLESGYAADDEGCATDDLNEIYGLRRSLPSDVNIVVQAGGSKQWSSQFSSVISPNKRNRFHLTTSGYSNSGDGTQVDKVNMGSESSLKEFVQWGLETYPADKVGLIFWNHGGAMGGCCYDEQFNDDKLTPAEVASAVPAAISDSNYNQNLEFIGYDCCLMSVQDIASLNSRYANYMIASEESEWGYGWSYDKFVDDLMGKKSTETILKACVDGFASDTTSAYNDWGDPNDQTLAYYNLQNWSAYESAWENFASYLDSNVITSSSSWTTFKNVVNSAQKYGYSKDASKWNNGYIYDIFDVKDFLNKMKTNNNYKNNSGLMTQVNNVLSAFSGLGVYSWCGSSAGNSNGLCMFCPISGYNEMKGEYAAANTKLTHWRDLCVEYGNWYDK